MKPKKIRAWAVLGTSNNEKNALYSAWPFKHLAEHDAIGVEDGIVIKVVIRPLTKRRRKKP